MSVATNFNRYNCINIQNMDKNVNNACVLAKEIVELNQMRTVYSNTIREEKEQMKNYEEIRDALLLLCENENLRFIETELEDETIVCKREGDNVILNKSFFDFEKLTN